MDWLVIAPTYVFHTLNLACEFYVFTDCYRNMLKIIEDLSFYIKFDIGFSIIIISTLLIRIETFGKYSTSVYDLLCSGPGVAVNIWVKHLLDIKVGKHFIFHIKEGLEQVLFCLIFESFSRAIGPTIYIHCSAFSMKSGYFVLGQRWLID